MHAVSDGMFKQKWLMKNYILFKKDTEKVVLLGLVCIMYHQTSF